ncbi:MAG: hypothetical protein PGN12_01690 [Sphingomonas phyllosphaerae]
MILLEYDIDESPARRLPSPGRCIYCGATGVKLNEEHVIPFAIGKNATILEEACCENCQKIIQPYEQRVLRHQLGVFRAMVEAPTRNKKDRPKVIRLPLVEIVASGTAGRDLGMREVPIAQGPLILNLWQSPPPSILGETIDPANADGGPWRFIESSRADPILQAVADEQGVERVGIVLPPVNRLDYLRSLAKTAHAYAVAELGVDSFEPFLRDVILNTSDDIAHFVGDMPRVANLEGPTGHSFKITLGQTPPELGDAGGLIVVFMQFWAELGSPPHLVVVGRPLIDMDEHFTARSAQYLADGGD